MSNESGKSDVIIRKKCTLMVLRFLLSLQLAANVKICERILQACNKNFSFVQFAFVFVISFLHSRLLYNKIMFSQPQVMSPIYWKRQKRTLLCALYSDVIEEWLGAIKIVILTGDAWNNNQRAGRLLRRLSRCSEGKGRWTQRKMLRPMTHPFVGESGDLFSSIDSLVTADALADDELQDCVAVAPTTFWAALFLRPGLSVCRCPNVIILIYRCQC